MFKSAELFPKKSINLFLLVIISEFSRIKDRYKKMFSLNWERSSFHALRRLVGR